MNWVLLLLAGLFEIVGVIGLQKTVKKETWLTYVFFIGAFTTSFSLLIFAMKTIPLSTAYAVWTGIGTAGAAVVGMTFFGEAKSPLRMLCLVGVILSVIGLKLFA
ncbi:DMT family transporter [Ktedonobacter racemifer]|uniref:Small multidrug resistance protein n=1 Tax=Ktedonobacter racemifer DSM 44963 TaxID=485913 RepID=D6TYM1_KTERA|nr:multidrug efflux SMR transporter [Ktedonobacter racemifer]EFH85096.1 small multidrug resistance protein [Ktedonobacter racemifer DSM 44963]